MAVDTNCQHSGLLPFISRVTILCTLNSMKLVEHEESMEYVQLIIVASVAKTSRGTLKPWYKARL